MSIPFSNSFCGLRFAYSAPGRAKSGEASSAREQWHRLQSRDWNAGSRGMDAIARLGKIVNHHLHAIGLERLLHKFDVLRMFLVAVLRGLVVENDVQRHLV